eukprot:Em0017g250a
MEKRAEDEKDVYDITLNYIARGTYPQDATKQDKCAIRKRAEQYRVQDGQLYKVQHCDQCQKTKRKFDHPAEELHPVPVPNRSWKQIGIDLIGPLPTTANVVDDNIVDEVEELDNSDMECAGEQEQLMNAELDLQQEEYALSKDIDVSLWIEFPVTGSLEFHEELRLLITTYMIYKSTDPMLSSLGSPVGSV